MLIPSPFCLQVCRALAEAGASVALLYTSSKNSEETAKKLSDETGSKVVAYRTDVKDKATITATINQVVADFGKLDICVANAGIAEHDDSLDYGEDAWRKMMAINLDGAFFTAQAAGNIFKKQGPGPHSMIFTASVSAYLVNIPQKQAPYNASKAAVVHLAKSLAVGAFVGNILGIFEVIFADFVDRMDRVRSSKLHIAGFHRY